MHSGTMRVTLMDEADLKRIAHVIGGSSAAACALRDAERRRAAGEDPVIVAGPTSYLVVPRSELVPADEEPRDE